MSTLGYRQGSGEAIPTIIHPSYVAGGQTWTVLSGVKKDVLNTVYHYIVILVITTAIAQKAEDAFTHITRPGPNEQPLTGFRQTRTTTTRDVYKTRPRL